jgi:hypothetical protein
MSRVLPRLKRELTGLVHWRMQRRLAQSRPGQALRFDRLKGQFRDRYAAIAGRGDDAFVTPQWRQYNAELARVLLPQPPFGFLKHPTIITTMFVIAGGRWMARELEFLEAHAPEGVLRAALAEDFVGEPLLLNSTYLTSHNSIHHLYHLLRFAERTQAELEQLATVVEWGGGYGNQAKIFRRLAGSVTYVVIDTPLFCCLQWLYLSTVFGQDEVHLIGGAGAPLAQGGINLLPLAYLEDCELNANLFISTWALSESSRQAQDYVVDRQWFGAEHLLLACQGSSLAFPEADRTAQLAKSAGAVVEAIEFLPGNHYALR